MPKPRADLAILGPYPPPFGGISIHIQRLLPRLDANRISWRLYNLSSESVPDRSHRPIRFPLARYLAFLATSDEPLVHIHGLDHTLARLGAVVLRQRKRKVVLSYHNERIIGALRSRRRPLIVAAARAASAIHSVNPRISAAFVEAGVSPDKILTLPAFLPPSSIESPLPEHIDQFIREHSPCMLVMGTACDDIERDRYGLYLLPALLARLAAEYPHVGVVITITGKCGIESGVVRALRAGLDDLGVRDRALITNAFDGFVSLLKRVDAYLRPSMTDGDALAVREALWFGVPVVASDAAPRPEGTTLFRSGDPASLLASTLVALSDRRDSGATRQTNDPGEAFIALYRRLLGSAGVPIDRQS